MKHKIIYGSIGVVIASTAVAVPLGIILTDTSGDLTVEQKREKELQEKNDLAINDLNGARDRVDQASRDAARAQEEFNARLEEATHSNDPVLAQQAQDLLDARNEEARLRRELETATHERDAKQQELAEANTKLQEETENLNTLQEELDALTAAGATPEKIAELQQQVDDATDAVNTANNLRNSAIQARNDAIAEQRRLQSALTAKEGEITTLNSRVSTLDSEISDLNEAVSAANAAKAEAEMLLIQKQDELNIIRQQLDEFKSGPNSYGLSIDNLTMNRWKKGDLVDNGGFALYDQNYSNVTSEELAGYSYTAPTGQSPTAHPDRSTSTTAAASRQEVLDYWYWATTSAPSIPSSTYGMPGIKGPRIDADIDTDPSATDPRLTPTFLANATYIGLKGAPSEANKYCSIDLSKSKRLETFELVSQQDNLHEIDFSHNPLLKTLKLRNGSLNHLDLSNNPLLEELDLTDFNSDACSIIDIRGNTNLNKIVLNRPNITPAINPQTGMRFDSSSPAAYNKPLMFRTTQEQFEMIKSQNTPTSLTDVEIKSNHLDTIRVFVDNETNPHVIRVNASAHTWNWS